MKKFSLSLVSIAVILCLVGISPYQVQAQSIDFQGFAAGDTLAVIGWSGADVTAKIVDSSGNKVLQNTIRNYNAAPVLMLILPEGKTLADYGTFSFKGYFAQGDVGYKNIEVEAYQTKPTAQAFNTPAAKIGTWNRAQMGSTSWEDIKIDITNTSTFDDTIYIAFGINCAGTGDVGGTGVTTIWLADDIKIVENFAIVIDGDKDSFYDGLTGPADGYLQLRNYAGNNNGTPANNADLSAKVWAAWDSTWFYMYTEVMDDTISDNGANSYQDDGLELKIDPKATDSVANSIFAPNFTALGGTGSDSLNAFPATAKQWVRKTITGGYALEFAVRWDSIGTSEKVSIGIDSVFGLAINFHDNDGNLNIGGGRQASVQWAAVMMDQVWNTPKYLGTVKFLADNKLSFIPKNNMTGVENPIPFDGTPFYVNVDGARDPIYSIATAPDDGYLQLRSYASNNNGRAVSDADLSAKVWSVWDPTWFYMYAEVTDDTISDNGVNSYQDDGLELKIDPQATDSVANSIFAPNFTALGGTGSDSLNAFSAGAKKWSRTRTATGYTLEFAVRWDSIGTSEKVSVGIDSVFGLAINFHDNDGNLSIGGGRQASVQWAAVMRDEVWNTPKYLGTVKFLADNKLSFIPKNNMTGVYNPIPYNGKDTVVTGVQRVGTAVPASFSLGQNYPNPFNPSTTIQFGLPVTSNVRIMLFNMLGQMVGEVARGEYEAGNHKVVFNASHMASGVYLYRLEAGSFTAVKKLVLLK